MTLVIVLNAILAVLIVAAIVALHAFAILSDRPRRRRPSAVMAWHPRPIRPRPGVPELGPDGSTRRTPRQRRERGVALR